MNYEQTSLWKKTLGIQGNDNIDRLRISYTTFREHMKGMLDEVRKDFPNLTDHSIEHVDNLWVLASLITGEEYPINPLEGFVLGCSFLVHDSMLSYKAFGGKDNLRNTIEWKDYYQDIASSEYDTEEGKQKIDFKVIRQLHAKKCGDILSRQFEGVDGNDYYLLSDNEMREHYGQLIGEIASSHQWDTEKISTLTSQVNGLAMFPKDWIICPRKLACILRCADAAAIDSGRAPDYLFRILRLNGVSRDHWVAQNRLGVSLDVKDSSRLIITSTHDFEEKDFSAWNVAYDAVKVIDEELEKCNELLSEPEKFHVKSITGAKSRKSLASYIKTRGWEPSDVNVHISDVAHLIMTLGGKELYGKNDNLLIVLRELIQNARDAIHARKLLEGAENYNGKINVTVSKVGEEIVLSVVDNGVGMSLDTITHSLLDFGSSFWHEDSVNVEFPGLKSSGFKSVGQFGIGFFSVFMIAKSVNLETRKYTDGIKDAHLVKFPSGLTLAPVFANYTSSSTTYSTKVSLILDDEHKVWPVDYEVIRNKINELNFKVPFSAMLSTLVAGLDVDVYYQEFENKPTKIHHKIDAHDLDKRAWLRSLALADYQQDKELDDYIEANYNRLQYIYDEQKTIVGLAAISTRFLPKDDFLGGTTVGGLLTSFHSREGEYWIGILEHTPNGAKRGGGGIKAPTESIKAWTNEQFQEVQKQGLTNVYIRYRLQLAMQYFKIDPSKIAIAFIMQNDASSNCMVFSLDELVKNMIDGKKLIFVDSNLVSKKKNEGHGDVYLDFNRIKTLLNENEFLFYPIMNSGFLSYKFIEGVPENNYGFIDCLYRTAKSMGHTLCFSYREDYITNNLGATDRALMIEI